MDKSQLKKVIKLIQTIFLFLCFFYLLKFFINSWENLVIITKQANFLYLFLSLVAWQILIFIVPYFSYHLILAQNSTISYISILHIYINRLPAKYIPGGIWQTVARFHDLNKIGIAKTELSILIFYENIWSALIAGFIGSIGIIFLHSDTYWGKVAVFIFLLCVFCLLLIFFFNKIKFILSFQSYFIISIIDMFFWLFAATSFYFYICSLMIFSSETTIISNSINYVFSWLIGFLSIFTPQGIGVFELTMSQLSLLNYSLEETIVFLAGFRLIVFISDILSWSVFILWKKYYYESS